LTFRGRVRKVGRILHRSPIAPNIWIAKVNDYIEEGTIIYDQSGEKIGVAIETFGPTNSPYLRIKTEKSDRNIKLEEGDIFIIENMKEKIEWRKKRRRRKKHGKRGNL